MADDNEVVLVWCTVIFVENLVTDVTEYLRDQSDPEIKTNDAGNTTFPSKNCHHKWAGKVDPALQIVFQWNGARWGISRYCEVPRVSS